MIQDLDEAVAGYRLGRITEEELRSRRKRWGVYAQRQPGLFTLRIRGTGGMFTAEQMEEVAAVRERFGKGPVHLTTRQGLQVYGVELEAASSAIRMLEAAGLSTRETSCPCVRSVMTCPLAGMCRDEVVDVRHSARELTERFVGRLPRPLPRKVKIALSGCATDCALASIHDLGLVAVRGEEENGFRVLVGGGLGAAPKAAVELSAFTGERDAVPLAEAVIQVFDRMGNRESRARARLKFLVEEIGIAKFRRVVEEELGGGGAGGQSLGAARQDLADAVPNLGKDLFGTESRLRGRPPAPLGFLAGRRGNGFERWRFTNTVPQRQAGVLAVQFRIPCGEAAPAQLRAVAELSRRFGRGEVRVTPRQNLLVPWVPDHLARDLYDGLSRHDLHAADAGRLADVTVCPGADTCAGAITSGRQLAVRLAPVLEEFGDDPVISGMWVAVSGCPNSCSRHEVADLGLYGAAERVGTRWVPWYQMTVGEASAKPIRFSMKIAKVPAQRAAQAAGWMLRHYRDNRAPDESMLGFVERMGAQTIRQDLSQFAPPSSFELDESWYRDLGSREEFTVRPGGPPEC